MTVRRGIGLLLAGMVLLLATLWYWLLHTESGARWIWSQVQSASNGQLQADAISGDLGGGLSIRQLRLESDGVALLAESARTQIDVDLLPPQVEIQLLHIESVDLRLLESDSEPKETTPAETLRELQLPVKLVFTEVEVKDIGVQPAGGSTIALDRAATRGSWYRAVVIEDLHVEAETFAVRAGAIIDLTERLAFRLGVNAEYQDNLLGAEAAGSVNDYDYNLAATVTNTQFGDLTALAQGNGNLESLFVDSLLVGGDGVEASGNAEVVWPYGLEATVNLDVATFDLSRVVTAWPVEHPLNGQITVNATGSSVVVEDSIVRVTGLPAETDLNVQFDRESAELSGEVAWREIGWPIAIPAVTSKTGNVQVSGSLDDWRVAGTIDVGTAQMPDGRFTVDGGGDRDSARARILDGRALGGSVAGEVAYTWRDTGSWTATLEVAEMQTTELLPDWPGYLSGGVQAEGTSTPFSIAAQLSDVSGVLRDKPLRAAGRFAHDTDVTTAEGLEIRHGNARVELDGSADTPAGLQFSVQLDELADYLDGASGDLAAQGRVSRFNSLFVEANLESSRLAYGSVELANIRVKDVRDHDSILGIEANVEQLSAAGQSFEEILLTFDYAPAAQQVSIEGGFGDAELALSLAGAFEDWRRPADSPWRGEVRSFDINLGDEHSFSLSQAAQLALSPQQVSLSDYCLRDSDDAEMCIDFGKQPDGAISLAAALTRVPAMLSEHFVDHDLVMTQNVSGDIEWQRASNGDTDGRADLQIAAGRISSAGDPDLALDTDAGRIGFTVRNKRLLAGNLYLPMPDVGQIDAEFAVLDVRRGVSSGITGDAQLNMSDIGMAANFSPVIDSIGGSLDGSFALTGTVGNPVVTGSLKVVDGDLLYAPIGLHLQDIDLQGRLVENRSFQLGGRFRAGDGHGRVISSADYGSGDHQGLRFRVQGSDLQLIDAPQVQAVIAPDFEVTYFAQQLGINGSVDITRARIAPTTLSEGRVNESDDVVIVAGELPDKPATTEDEQRVEYSGVLDVTLGDSVVIELDVAKASLGGAVSFNWQGDALPLADGRIDVNGSVEAFGQLLEVTEGAIRFPGVPADNPDIRLRAEREIYGNSQVKRAGVLVDGPAARPTVEAYTVPMTTEERALTLLVTGSDFDYEQGVGAVDFGTYIAPRLFVSYGIGIFDQDNVISARYDLTQGFGIKASSGSKESGVDLNYRIQN